MAEWILAQSKWDSSFVEVRLQSDVVEEIFAPFFIFCRKIPDSFPSLEEAKRWLVETEKKVARSRACWLLAQRSYSSKKLLDKLEEKKFSSKVCEEVIEEMTRLGFLQDEEYAKQLALREARRGMGPRRIALKMKSQGLSGEKISHEDQREQIKALWGKLTGSREKKARALLRRGFDSNLVFEFFSQR